MESTIKAEQIRKEAPSTRKRTNCDEVSSASKKKSTESKTSERVGKEDKKCRFDWQFYKLELEQETAVSSMQFQI
jgi:hypothetical protein